MYTCTRPFQHYNLPESAGGPPKVFKDKSVDYWRNLFTFLFAKVMFTDRGVYPPPNQAHREGGVAGASAPGPGDPKGALSWCEKR